MLVNNKVYPFQKTLPFSLMILFLFLASLGFLLLCAGFSLVAEHEPCFSCSPQAPHCGGFSCYTARVLGTQALVAVAPGL